MPTDPCHTTVRTGPYTAVRAVLGRNMLIAGLAIVGLIVASVLFAFLARELSYRKAERARSSVHAGMSVAEVWHSVTGWILLGASSDVPETDPDLHHAVNLSFHSQSNKFFYFERARSADRQLSESEALGVLHQKLGDGTIWRFKYTFINDTPQHFSFTVVFDKNGRVQEVTLIYGWD